MLNGKMKGFIVGRLDKVYYTTAAGGHSSENYDSRKVGFIMSTIQSSNSDCLYVPPSTIHSQPMIEVPDAFTIPIKLLGNGHPGKVSFILPSALYNWEVSVYGDTTNNKAAIQRLIKL
jgi:hypothetical protein